MTGTEQKPIRKGVFLNLSLFSFLSFLRRGVFYTFMINYLFSLMQTVTYTALLGTLDMAASALGQNLLWGKIADRHGIRAKLILAGEFIAAIAYLIVFLIHRSLINADATFMAGLSLIIGLSTLEFFWSMSDVGWAALLTDVTTGRTRGKVIGIINFIASSGRMVGIIFSGFLYNNGQGFQQGTIFYIVIAMLMTTTIVMWITSRLTEKPNAKKEKNTAITNNQQASSTDQNKSIYNWFLTSLIVVILGATCTSQVFLLYLKLPDGLNASDPAMSLILTAWTLGGMLTCLVCGWLADRFGRTKVLLGGLILSMLTPLFYGSALDASQMALLYGLNGVAFWTTQTVGFAFVGDLIPEDKRGRLLSRYNTVMALSWGPAGLLIGGPLADFQTKSMGLDPFVAYVNTFFVSSLLVTLGAIIFVIKVVRPFAKHA